MVTERTEFLLACGCTITIGPLPIRQLPAGVEYKADLECEHGNKIRAHAEPSQGEFELDLVWGEIL